MQFNKIDDVTWECCYFKYDAAQLYGTIYQETLGFSVYLNDIKNTEQLFSSFEEAVRFLNSSALRLTTKLRDDLNIAINLLND